MDVRAGLRRQTHLTPLIPEKRPRLSRSLRPRFLDTPELRHPPKSAATRGQAPQLNCPVGEGQTRAHVGQSQIGPRPAGSFSYIHGTE